MIAILITGIISLIIALLAYFGMNMGTFVISLDETAYRSGIVLSTDPDFHEKQPSLLINPLNNAAPVTYTYLNIDGVMNTNGNYKDPDGYTYLAYTFYLKNDGDTTVDIQFFINVAKSTKNVDSALRLMVIEDDSVFKVYYKDNGESKIYMDGTNVDAIPPEDGKSHFVVPWTTNVVSKDAILNFRPNSVKKYSIIIWLEGYDIDCVDEIKGGQLKMNFNFEIIGAAVQEEEA